MVTNFNLVYSASAAARILGIVYQKRIVIQEWASVVWVHVLGYRPRFMSKTAFKQHFVNWRKAAARALQVTQSTFSPSLYIVRNESKGSRYQVRVLDTISCTCEDYRNQMQFLGKGACKHIYATLGHLGHSSLQDYLNVQSSTALACVAAGRNSIIPFAPRQRATTFAGVSID